MSSSQLAYGGLLLHLILPSISASCPAVFPSLDESFTQDFLAGEWVDAYSSRSLDTHFQCTHQNVSIFNSTAHKVTTSSKLVFPVGPSFVFEFLNVAYPKATNVFHQNGENTFGKFFHNSTLLIADYSRKLQYYAWYICNESDEYEFHINVRPGVALSDDAVNSVLKVFHGLNLNPGNATFNFEAYSKYCPKLSPAANRIRGTASYEKK
ncbi:hypothetical protein CYMTET_42522 [Cymbomonas tetramitiformis]|uniref:Lipocalin/cytosolic fatty-acid binding domain-containing protein n=1 Tax=Cymbomonas tetramitiformis TaxID=36881 RepID=A0AAE0C5A3_9CHLO|nr:hypothetical protein CYMTET_42522 [Cymbomonas tetramitiformis]|eukprot:gene25667-31387_t